MTKKTGRPLTVLTDEQVQSVERLAAVLNQSQIADFLGIGERTLRDILVRDEAVSAAYKRGRARAIEGVGSKLLQAALEGDAVRQMFYLKTQAGWRETQDIMIKAEAPFDGFMLQRAQSDNADTD